MLSGRYVEQGKGKMINMGEEEIENQPLEADLFCHYHSHGVEAQCIAWILMSLNILYIWRCNWYQPHMGVPDYEGTLPCEQAPGRCGCNCDTARKNVCVLFDHRSPACMCVHVRENTCDVNKDKPMCSARFECSLCVCGYVKANVYVIVRD